MKYIIKNCPCYIEQEPYGNTCCQLYTCESDIDCLLKRIVDECKKETIINCNIDGKEQVLKAHYHTHIGDKILELLEIEEVDEM